MKDILIIEDERDIREAIETRLLSEGYSVRVADTTEIGLMKVMEKKPDLILLDIITRSIHGALFMQRLRQLPPEINDCKVIVVTNLDNDVTREKIEPYGIEDYLVKAETSLDQVVEKVAKVLAEENKPTPE